MSVDLAATRAGIATLLDQVSLIRTVVAYERADIPTNNLPSASIILVRVTQPGYDGGIGQLGAYVYEAEWKITVALVMPQGSAPEVAAQELFESIFEAVRAQFDGNQLIDPNGPGVVDVSAITSGDLLYPTADGLPFICQLQLKTRVIA